MTPELVWTTWTAILAASLWIPYIVGVNTSEAGSPADFDSRDFSRPAEPSLQRPWVHRAYRAHLNLLEQFMPMAALVLIAHVAGVTNAVTVWATGLFFALRVIHAVGMITGIAVLPARPILFTAGWACVMAMAAAVLLG